MTTERILIVDDEETLCEVLKLNLENEGYDVDIAFSAEQALTYDLTAYSLILLDIMMGEMMKADVKTAVQFHGGTITATNRPGGGLRFDFSLRKQTAR